MKPEPDYNLIARHLAGQLDASGERMLAAWRAQSAEHEKVFGELEKVWAENAAPLPDEGFDVSSGKEALVARLGLASPDPVRLPAQPTGKPGDLPVAQPRPGVIYPVREPAEKPAARMAFSTWALGSVAAMLCIGFLFWFFSNGQEDLWQEAATLALQRETISLEDGSVVRLNAGSQLRWRSGVKGETREIHFRGQGYFEVAKGDRPFVVFTENSRVQVVGTAFEVWARGEKTRVVVREGRVSLAKRDGSDRLYLNANQFAAVSGDEMRPVQEVDASSMLAWLDGRLLFRQQPLREAVFDLEQIFGVELTLEDPSLGDLLITASFANPDLETVLSEICQALNLTHETDGDRITISRK